MPDYKIARRHSHASAAWRLLCALAVMATASLAMADWPANVTPEEIALSPPYCAYYRSENHTSGMLSPRGERWRSLLGSGFMAMHHYCYGQILLQRAMRSSATANERKFLLESTRGEFQYVVRNSPSDFVLLPEIHTRIGEVEIRLSLYNDANKSFAQARALKPDYWPAYLRWADFLISVGKRAEAKQLIKTALEYSPQARPLIEQYRQLGGNAAEIVPKSKANGQSAKEAAAPAEAIPADQQTVETSPSPVQMLPRTE